jgi:pilus assembly protein CpaB
MLYGRSLIIFGIAVLLGLAAVLVANAYLGGVADREAKHSGGMVKVAVARVPLDFGAAVTPEKVRYVDWPNWSVPEGTFTSDAQLLPMGKQRLVLRPMAVNEPILNSKLSGEGGRATIAAMLRPDMRAFAVRVSEVSGVAGFVLPGDVVDVLVTRTLTDSNSQQITDVLLQNVRVVAIDQDANDGKSDPRIGKTATLEVSQADAQKLALAQQIGSLSLALKKPSDQTSAAVRTVGTQDLRDGAHLSGPVAVASNNVSVPRVWRAVHRPSLAPVLRTITVEIVRGTTGKDYEVGHHVGL